MLSISLDTAGNRWLAMPTAGLMVHYGGSTFQWFATSNSSIQSNSLNAVYADTSLRAYIGSQQEGLIIKQGLSFTGYDPGNSPMPDNNVLCVTKDKDNILWAGTMYGGLVWLEEALLNSVEEQEPVRGIDVYPGIVRKGESVWLFVKGSARIILYDSMGKTCMLKNHTEGEGLRIDLAGGLYLVVVQQDDRIRYGKVMVID